MHKYEKFNDYRKAKFLRIVAEGDKEPWYWVEYVQDGEIHRGFGTPDYKKALEWKTAVFVGGKLKAGDEVEVIRSGARGFITLVNEFDAYVVFPGGSCGCYKLTDVFPTAGYCKEANRFVKAMNKNKYAKKAVIK